MVHSRLTFLLVAFLCGAVWSRASDSQPTDRDIEVRFVPPGDEGTVSMGIYSTSGKLVRVLADEWPLTRFRVGRDALSTTWNGGDSEGMPVAAGAYSVRGFVVGKVEVLGEAFHFNDWIDDADSPRLTTISAQQLLSGGDILLAVWLAGGNRMLVRYSPQSDVQWHSVTVRPSVQPAKNVQMAVSETLAFVMRDDQLMAMQLADGQDVVLPLTPRGLKDVAARGARLALLDMDGVHFYGLPDFAPQGDAGVLPANLESVTLLGENALVGAARDGSVWVWRSSWARLDIPEDVLVREVSGGRDGTFWALQETPSGAFSIAQYSPEEGKLAEWVPRAEDGKLVAISGSPDSDSFVASLVLPDVQRTVAIRRKKDGVGWEFVFDKKITASSGFGWANGKLVASSAELPEELKVNLAANPLDPSAPRTLTLRAVANDMGTGLSTTDGLPLLRITEQAGFGRVMLLRGETPNTARFFQGDGACVEEYQVSGLDDIISFDAGTIEMTGMGEAPSPPPVEPGEE